MTINYLGNYFAPRGSKNPTGASNTAKAKTEGVPIADVDDVDRSPFNDDNEFDTATPASSFSSSLASKIFNIEKLENLERRHYYYGNNDWKRKTHTHTTNQKVDQKK